LKDPVGFLRLHSGAWLQNDLLETAETIEKKTMKQRVLYVIRRVFPWLIVAALVLLAVHIGGRISDQKQQLEQERRNASGQEPAPVNVITLLVKPGPLADRITLPAEIAAEQELWIKAEVSGRVAETLVKEGSALKEGQRIIKLDDRDYRSRLARIEAGYSLARTEYKRNLALARTNATAQATLDNLEARLKELEAQKNEAAVALERTEIRAPISCILNELKAREGDFVNVGDPVAQILNIDPVKVVVGVPESDVAAVFEIEEAEVVIPALGGMKVVAKKIFLSRKPRTLARLYDLELELANPEGRILPGMFARVNLVKQTFDQAVTVPLYAVLSRGNEQYVFIETDGKAEKRTVSTGLIDGWEIHITEGLNEGDRVVIVGHRSIEQGRALNIVENVTDPAEIVAR
jgi:membrane fusion protein, multidrug efflux system